jgi:formate hydrogenlyase subunit 3/multisubunit Na+/H+ antiporter MnhD subunit
LNIMNRNEKIAEIRRRESDIREKRNRRGIVMYALGSAFSCLLLALVSVGVLGHAAGSASAGGTMTTEFGSVFAGDKIGGMVLMVVLAFALGVCVTMLFVKLHDRNERRKKR